MLASQREAVVVLLCRYTCHKLRDAAKWLPLFGARACNVTRDGCLWPLASLLLVLEGLKRNRSKGRAIAYVCGGLASFSKNLCLVAALATVSLGAHWEGTMVGLLACPSFLPHLLLGDMLPITRDFHLRTRETCSSASTSAMLFPFILLCLLFLYQSCHHCCFCSQLNAARLTSPPCSSIAASQRRQNNKLYFEARKAPPSCLSGLLSLAVASGRLEAKPSASRYICIFLPLSHPPLSLTFPSSLSRHYRHSSLFSLFSTCFS